MPITTIQVTSETRKKLAKLKSSSRQTYDDLIVTQFGTERITPDLLERIRKIAGELHPMLRRGVFYSHRDMNWVLDEYEKGNRFALYTGRGPSSGIHIGHMLPWFFAKWLQEKFRATMYFQITDDEKFLFKDFD